MDRRGGGPFLLELTDRIRFLQILSLYFLSRLIIPEGKHAG